MGSIRSDADPDLGLTNVMGKRLPETQIASRQRTRLGSLQLSQTTPPTRETSEVELLARVFAGVSDMTRLHILLALLERERNVSELVVRVGASQGRVSMHLQCLRWCGFVTSERRGKYVYYRVRDERVQQLIALARAFAAAFHQELASCAVLNFESTRSENEAV